MNIVKIQGRHFLSKTSATHRDAPQRREELDSTNVRLGDGSFSAIATDRSAI